MENFFTKNSQPFVFQSSPVKTAFSFKPDSDVIHHYFRRCKFQEYVFKTRRPETWSFNVRVFFFSAQVRVFLEGAFNGHLFNCFQFFLNRDKLTRLFQRNLSEKRLEFLQWFFVVLQFDFIDFLLYYFVDIGDEGVDFGKQHFEGAW